MPFRNRSPGQGDRAPCCAGATDPGAGPLSAVFASGVLWLIAAMVAPAGAAHPVSITVAHVYVSQEQISVKLQVFLEDLYLFHGLQPNASEFLDRDVIERGIELHREFVGARFAISDVAGARIPGRVVAVQDEDVPTEGVALAELMAHQLTFELEYALSSVPDFLTFSQQFTDEEGMLPSEMKVIVKQEGAAALEPFVLRPDDMETIRLDWERPPLSPEASAEERSHWAAEQQEQTLGITSYSSVYSFLYVDHFEVRHEILIPLLTLEQSVLIARDNDEFLDLAEQDAARQQIEAYFCAGNPIEIDGAPGSPRVERCDFYGLDFRDFAVRAERRRVPTVTARVGIILSYPAARPPQSVKLTWDRFNSFIWNINLVAFAFDDVIKAELSRLGDRNVWRWEGPRRRLPPPPQAVAVSRVPAAALPLPVLSLASLVTAICAVPLLARAHCRRATRLGILAGFVLAAVVAWPYARWNVPNPLAAGRGVSGDRADAVFATLHRNLYRAFDYRTEGEIYDVLAASAAGDFLLDAYLQIRQGLIMQEQGGAVSRVRQVSILAGGAEPLPAARGGGGFAYRCRWTVAGTVEHWGHIHERINQYEGLFRVEPVQDVWKFTDLELLSEERLQFETRLRKR